MTVKHGKLVLLLVVSILTLLLASCGGGEAPASPPTSAPLTEAPISAPAEIHPTDTALPPTETPTNTPEPTPTPEPLQFTLDELLASTEAVTGLEPCELGKLTMQCPSDWAKEEEDGETVTYASSEAILDGFQPGETGGQIQVNILDVFQTQKASPEDILEQYVGELYPGGIPLDHIMDGPTTFVLNETDAAALIFTTEETDPELVVMALALQKNGQVATVAVSASTDAAAELFPTALQGVAALNFDVPTHYFAKLPPGSTYSALGAVNGEGIPSQLFSNSNQAVFIAAEPLNDVELKLDLIDLQSGTILASSDRKGNEYIYYEIKKPGRYGYRVNSQGNVSYVTTVIATDGVTIAADALENTFSGRLDFLTNLTYMAMVNQGESIYIQLQAGAENQELTASIYGLDDMENPLAVVEGEDTKGFTFAPPSVDWYLIAIQDKNGMPGVCMVTINYVK